MPDPMTAPTATYRRLGRVRATRLHEPREWRTDDGTPLVAEAGDWWVTTLDGEQPRSVTDASFRATHEREVGDVWRRTGTVEARQVRESEIVHSHEGDVVARPGDWVLTDSGGSSWPVTDDYLRTHYEPIV